MCERVSPFRPAPSTAPQLPPAPRFNPMPMPARFLALALLLGVSHAAAAQSLFSDPKAARVGDPLTVVLAERTAASSRSQFEDRSQAGINGAASTSGDAGKQFGLDANVSQNAAAQNQAVQSDLLSGTITAVVVGVDATGNLQIEGERTLHVNGVTHLMKVSGTVRPLDVTYDNTILSYQIANADVEYRQKGIGSKFLRPGTLLKAAAAALLAAAVFLGS